MHLRSLQSVICALLAFSAAGCAGPAYEGRYRWDKGWRRGAVTDPAVIGTQEAAVDCRVALDGAVTGSRRFARVRYSFGRTFRSMIALVPDNEQLHAGQAVYVDTEDCTHELVPR